jgi:hypothetical protein
VAGCLRKHRESSLDTGVGPDRPKGRWRFDPVTCDADPRQAVVRWACARRDGRGVKEVAGAEFERFGEPDQHADADGKVPALKPSDVGLVGAKPLREPALRPAEVFAAPADACAKGHERPAVARRSNRELGWPSPAARRVPGAHAADERQSNRRADVRRIVPTQSAIRQQLAGLDTKRGSDPGERQDRHILAALDPRHLRLTRPPHLVGARLPETSRVPNARTDPSLNRRGDWVVVCHPDLEADLDGRHR